MTIETIAVIAPHSTSVFSGVLFFGQINNRVLLLKRHAVKLVAVGIDGPLH